jgi:hypothetical protein
MLSWFVPNARSQTNVACSVQNSHSHRTNLSIFSKPKGPQNILHLAIFNPNRLESNSDSSIFHLQLVRVLLLRFIHCQSRVPQHPQSFQPKEIGRQRLRHCQKQIKPLHQCWKNHFKANPASSLPLQTSACGLSYQTC